MGRRLEGVRRRWGDVEFRSASEELGESAEWRLASDRHTLKVLRTGVIREYDGEIEDGPRGERTIRAGHISLVPAGHGYRSRGHGSAIAFSVLSFPDIGKAPPLLFLRDEFVYRSVVRIDEALTQGEERIAEVLSDALMLHLRSRYVQAPSPESGLSPRQIRRLDAYLETNLGERPTVSALAEVLDLPTARFSRAFRAAYGTTPAQHLLELRLTKARLRLESGQDRIAELAIDLGFANHGHLTTAFRKRYGFAPRDARPLAARRLLPPLQ